MLRKFFYLICGLVVGISLTCGYVFWQLKSWAQLPMAVETAVTVDFPRGTKLDELVVALEDKKLVSSASRMKLWVKFHGNYARFQAGKYRFSGEVTPQSIAKDISEGNSFTPVALQFVIPEGFTIKQVIERLAAKKVGSKLQLRRLVYDKDFLKQLEVPGKSLEGFLYPATYQFLKIPTPRQALAEMVKTFWGKLPPNYVQRLKEKKLTLHQGVTFASMIELETQHDDEKNKISEVIWSRLKNREPLAIDAALIYGIKDYRGDIKWSHLKDRKNPYNTRIHKGLPPGPIGAVALSTLEAVLQPTDQGYYYYVLIAGSTRHHFSKSLAEHNKYVKLLLDKRKK